MTFLEVFVICLSILCIRYCKREYKSVTFEIMKFRGLSIACIFISIYCYNRDFNYCSVVYAVNCIIINNYIQKLREKTKIGNL